MKDSTSSKQSISVYDRLRIREKEKFDNQRRGMLPKMDAATLKQICTESEGYETPELNDNLYAHFKGFQKIEGLEAYTGLKSLWLESNGLSKLENLDMLTQLRGLYVSKNVIHVVRLVVSVVYMFICLHIQIIYEAYPYIHIIVNIHIW